LLTGLETGQTLPNAIESIKEKHPNNYYLLFQGKTGILMKKLELCSMNADDMCNLIRLEISRLQSELDRPSTRYYFFTSLRTQRDKTKKEQLKKAIRTLKTIKKPFKDSATLTIRSEDETHLKNAGCGALLEKLTLWQNLHKTTETATGEKKDGSVTAAKLTASR
jgi:hypothetical protein